MTPAETYHTLADLVLITHVGFVAFVVGGLPLIICGGCCGWKWIRNPWFRAWHLAAIGLVVVQAWLGLICPLTTWEMKLRAHAGEASYDTTFIAHWLQACLYYAAPAWAFMVGYTMFGLAVAGSWFWFRPRPLRKPRDN